MQTKIRFASETHAEKAKRVLDRNHIAFQSKKITTPDGCMIILRIAAPADTVTMLMHHHGIPYQIG